MRRIDIVNSLLLMSLLAIAILSLLQSVSLQHSIVVDGLFPLRSPLMPLIGWLSMYTAGRFVWPHDAII